MKLILTSEVPDLGGKGDVVEVSEGYGRNYLLPKNLAVKATPGALSNAEALLRSRRETERRSFEAAEAVAKALVGTRVVVAARAGDEGKLFGSVSTADIVEGVKKFTGIELDKSHVYLPEPIKSIGLYEIRVKLHPDVEFPLSLDVIPA
ncbi:MAG: 50S ribosomal protein L9 [Actinobacteria bacterium]|nr:50S ribosomal protein L9 [Actinomycetota bacterium]